MSILFLSFGVAASDDHAPVLQKGGWELGVWTGGGTGLSGGEKNTNLWLAGGRFGKVLTTGKNNGSLEYVLEVIPAFVIFQKATVYGVDVTPFMLKWNFKTTGKVIPYFEFGAGLLFTADDVPERTSKINFTPQGGFGLHLFATRRHAITVGLKYMHISNGGLDHPNPGINTIQFQIGYGWFK